MYKNIKNKMKLILSEQEIRNIVASQSLEDIRLNSNGEYQKWDIQLSTDGYILEYIYYEQGDLKDKFKEVKN